jgi:hypothetical protein
LRPRRVFPKWQYYLLLIFNLAGRCSWSFALSLNTLPAMWDPLMALVEIVRRSIWFIFRIEKEYFTVLGSSNSLQTKPLLLTQEDNIINSSIVPNDGNIENDPNLARRVIINQL